jgi:hypothetical protein
LNFQQNITIDHTPLGIIEIEPKSPKHGASTTLKVARFPQNNITKTSYLYCKKSNN